MPGPPFHYPIANLFYRLNQRFSLPGLIVGAVFPDVEVPIIILVYGTNVPNRLVLHSLLGAATLGTLLATAFTMLLYAPIITRIFRFDRLKVRERCRFSSGLVLSCLAWNISHVLLDIPNHPYNPIFWPFPPYAVGSPLAPLVGGIGNASIIMETLLVLLFIALFWRTRKGFWEKLLVGN